MVFQRYRAMQQLGKGSFGTVYLAEGRQDNKKYVVKVVDNMRTNDLKVQEIRILLHLKHCNIIEMRDFYTSNAQLCIVMEYADGGDLRSEIVNARNEKAIISEEIISVWIIQVCWALDYLHNMQLIHRDVKPSNIFLLSNRRSVRLGDFGISKILDSVSERFAHETEGRVGTKRYMAPEVLTNKSISCQADIWSVGCVIFELSTLQHPTYEQTGRFFFDWIPGIYSRLFLDIICSCLCEAFDARPSPKELMGRLIAPYRESPSVRQIFHEAIIWQQQQLDMQMLAFQDQMIGLVQHLPSGSVSADSYTSSSQVRSFRVEEQCENGPQSKDSGCGRQSALEALRRDYRLSSTDRPKSDWVANRLASRTASCEILEKQSSKQALSNPEPSQAPGSVTVACSAHSDEQVCISEASKQGPSVSRTELIKVQASEGCCSAATLQQHDGLQPQHEEQVRHSLETRRKNSLGPMQEIIPCGGAHLACQSGPVLDPLDEAWLSGHVAHNQQHKCQSAMRDSSSGTQTRNVCGTSASIRLWDSCISTPDLRACRLRLPMETIWTVGKPEKSASATVGCLRDTCSDVESSDRTLAVAQLASAADSASRILPERLKPCSQAGGEEVTEQVCSDYDIMCHQVDARHSGGCPSESHSRFISHEAAAKRPSPTRNDSNELAIMMQATQHDLGIALPYDQSRRLSTCDTDCYGFKCRQTRSAEQHECGTEINKPIKQHFTQLAPFSGLVWTSQADPQVPACRSIAAGGNFLSQNSSVDPTSLPAGGVTMVQSSRTQAHKDRNTSYECYTSSYLDLCMQKNDSDRSLLTENESTSCGHPDTRKVIEDLHRIRFGIRATLAENTFSVRDSNLKLPGLGPKEQHLPVSDRRRALVNHQVVHVLHQSIAAFLTSRILCSLMRDG